jgi:hypothetical protein
MESVEMPKYDPEVTHYLQSGEQTIITPKIKEIVDSFSNGTFEEKIEDIFQYVKTLKRDETNKKEIFRKRTADQIIQDGFITGCTDEGLVFIALARTCGIPAKYIEAMRTAGLEDTNNNNGHIFVEVYSDEKGWEIIEPQNKIIGADSTKMGFTIVAEGLDSWDIGITDFQSLKEKFNEFRDSLKK